MCRTARPKRTPNTLAFYDKAEDRFEMLLNIFKVFGHTPELYGMPCSPR